MNRTVAKVLLAGTCTLIAVLSLVPEPDAYLPAGIEIWDKLEHAGAYAVLAPLGGYAFSVRRERDWMLVVAAAVAFGVAIEVLQGMVGTGRSADPADALANGIGAVAGVLVIRGLQGRRL